MPAPDHGGQTGLTARWTLPARCPGKYGVEMIGASRAIDKAETAKNSSKRWRESACLPRSTLRTPWRRRCRSGCDRFPA